MTLPAFKTEHYYAQYEFSAEHLLSVSDCESMPVSELLALANTSLDALADTWLGYTESQGNPQLRQAVASQYRHVNADDVIVLATPIEGIYLTMRTLLQADDEAIVLTPAYDALINLPASLSARVHAWPLQTTADGWQLDLEALRNLITPKTKLLVINFPHNPTGFLPSTQDYQALVAIAAEHDIWIYSDEMYRGLELNRATLPSVCDMYKRSVVLAGLSKTHGLPGLRAGWLIVPDNTLRDAIMNYKMYTSICPSAVTEFLATTALSVTHELLTRNKHIIQTNLNLANAFFKRWNTTFTWRAPQAGSVALVELNTPSAEHYCRTLAQNHGIVLLPANFLGYSDHFVRFGFGRRSFNTALESYEQVLHAAQDV